MLGGPEEVVGYLEDIKSTNTEDSIFEVPLETGLISRARPEFINSSGVEEKKLKQAIKILLSKREDLEYETKITVTIERDVSGLLGGGIYNYSDIMLTASS